MKRLNCSAIILIAVLLISPILSADGSVTEDNVDLDPLSSRDPGMGSYDIEITECGKDLLNINIRFGDPLINNIEIDGTAYSVLSFEGSTPYGVVGRPLLPSLSIPLALPSEKAEVHINVISEKKIEADPILPLQPADPDVIGEKEWTFIMDDTYYRQGGTYPLSNVQSESGMIGDVPFLMIRITPAMILEDLSNIIWMKEIELEIHLEGSTPITIPSSSPFMNIYSRIFLNWEEFLPFTSMGRAPSIGSELGCEYMIISHPSLMNSSSRLARWKNQMGIETKVYGLDQVGYSREHIKEFIQHAYDTFTPKPSYVLFMGDSDLLPTNYVHGHPYDRYLTGTDLWYSTVSGPDHFPDLFMGRIPANDLNQSDMMVDKIIGYEKDPPYHPGFYDNVTLAAYFQDRNNDGYADRRFAQTSEETHAFMTSLGYDAERIFFTDSWIDPTNWNLGSYSNGEPIPPHLLKSSGFGWDGSSANISSAFERGSFLVTHRDHGGTNGWGEPRFTSSNIRDLKNGDLLPVVFSINCLTGYFDNETALGPFTPSEESFAEHLVNQEGGGAIGVVAATRVSYSGYNDYFYKGLYDAIFPSLNTSLGNATGVYRMGEVLNYAKYFMSSTWGDAWGLGSLEYELFHYLGDPTMEIWTARPETITASHPTGINAGMTEISVNASEENATVCISRNGSILGVGTVLNGSVNVSVRPLCNGTITVTITKHDFRPYIANISVNATSVDLCVSDIFVNTSGPAGINWTVGGMITNSGTVNEFSINVSLNVDGKMVNSTKLPQLASGSSSFICFNWTPQNDGWHTVMIEVENKSEQINWNNYLDRSVMVTGDPDLDMDINGSIDLWWRTGEIKDLNISFSNEDHGTLTYELEEKCIFFDSFSDMDVSAANWINRSSTLGIGMNGLYPPSLPYSLDLLCGDHLISRVMDTTNYTELNLSFHMEKGGYSNLTESYDHLYPEYKDNKSQWIRLYDHRGDNYQQGYFTEHIYELPENASHDSFQFRFTTESTYDYFNNGPGVFCIDDIRITHNTQDFWISATNVTGSLLYQDEGDLTLSFNATSLPVGNHSTFITLISNDEEYGSFTIPVHFEVRENITPVADAGSDIVIDQHETVMFNGSDSTDNTGIINWTWTFYDGDDLTLFGDLAEYTFHDAGVYRIYLQVNDHALNMDIDTFNVTVLDITDPTADAGWDITIDQHETVSLNGSSSTDNVGITNWTWTINDGGIILFGSNPSHTFHNAGVFKIDLTVFDLLGNNDNDTITVTVNDTTEPIASAGWNITIDQHQEFILHGAGSSDNIGIINWTWEIILGDGSFFLFEEEAAYTIHEAGLFEVILNITDDRGNYGTDNLWITVNDTTPPEIPQLPDIVIDQGTVHLFNGSSCIDNVGVINWTWEFSYDEENILLYGCGPRFEFTFAGTYLMTLTIRDEAGSLISGYHNISVSDITAPRPIIRGDLDLDQHEILSLNGSSSTDNVGLIDFIWTIAGPGLNVERQGMLLEICLDNAGDYNVTLRVGDAVGNNASLSVTAMVRDTTPPICIVGGNVSIYQGSHVIFNGSDSHDNSGQINHTWTFEYANGTVTLFGPISSFLFEDAGNYTVTLTITDEEGNLAYDTLLITVIEEPEGDDTPDDDTEVNTDGEGSKRFPLLYIISFVCLLLLLVLGAALVLRRRRAIGMEEKYLDWEE